MASALFKECQILHNSKDMINYIVRDFYIENTGVTFGDFFTISAYQIFNIDVESTNIVLKMPAMSRIRTNIIEIKFFEICIRIGHI